jgi:hypothetical protein
MPKSREDSVYLAKLVSKIESGLAKIYEALMFLTNILSLRRTRPLQMLRHLLSVFYYEILNSPDCACHLAFDEPITTAISTTDAAPMPAL